MAEKENKKQKLNNTENVVEVPFGNAGFRRVAAAMDRRHANSVEERRGAAVDELAHMFMNRMRELGYSRGTTERSYFEDAVDYECKFFLVEVAKLAARKKVPKFFKVKVTVPKRE